MKYLILSVSFCMLPIQVYAGDFSGKKSLLCSVAEASECSAGSDCLTSNAANMDLPNFISINFKKKSITAAGKGNAVNKVATKKKFKAAQADITSVSSSKNMTILHGTQNGRGWSAAINQSTGVMSLAVSGDSVGFVVQGACLAK